MCTVLLPAGGYPIAVNKYITIKCRSETSILPSTYGATAPSGPWPSS